MNHQSFCNTITLNEKRKVFGCKVLQIKVDHSIRNAYFDFACTLICSL